VPALPPVYRGGPDLTPLPRDVKVDPQTGLVQPTHGVSLSSDPADLRRFGGAYEVVSFPEGLVIRQRGRRITHFELMPAEAMTFERYRRLLEQVVLKAPS
jgi:hypothetical protein